MFNCTQLLLISLRLTAYIINSYIVVNSFVFKVLTFSCTQSPRNCPERVLIIDDYIGYNVVCQLPLALDQVWAFCH